jgi:hypothetical protein
MGTIRIVPNYPRGLLGQSEEILMVQGSGSEVKDPAKANDQLQQQPKPVEGDHHSKMLADVRGDKAETRKVTDAGDKSPEKLAQLVTGQAREAYAHLNAAKSGADVINGYLQNNTKLDDKVTVKGADGKDRQITVADHIKELRKVVDSEANAAVVQGQKVDLKALGQAQSSAIVDRNAIAKELGLDTNTISAAKIKDAMAADHSRPDRYAALLASQQTVDTLKAVENAPAFTKMAYAQFKGHGLTSSDAVELGADGKLKVSTKDALDAMQLITEASGNNRELRNTKLYSDAVREIYPRLAEVTEKASVITKSLEQANELGKQGNKVEQEKALKAAVEQADTTNMAMLAQLLRDPKFSSRQDDKTLDQMATTVSMAGTARLKYAEFLTEQGRFGEAQVQALRVKSEVPEIFYHLNPTTNQPEYNKSRFLDLQALDSKVTAASNFDPAKLNGDINKFKEAMGKLQGEATVSGNDTDAAKADKLKNNKGAMVELKNLSESMDGQLATQKQQLEQSKQALETRKVELEKEQKLIDGKNFPTDEARQLEHNRVQREMELAKMEQKVIDDQLQNNRANTQLVRYMEVHYDIARDDRAAANAKLNEIAQLGPEFNEQNKAKLDQLREAAKEPGWWDTWGKKAAVVLAVGAGVAAGIWLGPGALATGAAAGEAAAIALGVSASVGTAVGTVGGIGAVTIAGAAAGGTVVGVGRGVAEMTGGVRTSQDSVLTDIKDGALAGGTAAFWTAAPLGAMKIMKAAAPVAEGGVVAKTATTISEAGFKNMGPMLKQSLQTLNVIKNPAPAIFGVGTAAVQTGLDKATDTRAHAPTTLGDDALGFGKQALINTMATPFSGLLSSEGSMARLASKMLPAANVAERAPMLASVLLAQGIQQPIATYAEYKQRDEMGAAYTGYRSSSTFFGPWSAGTYDAGKSVFQAEAMKGRYDALSKGLSSRFFSDRIFAPDYSPMLYNPDSDLTDAEQIAAKRDQQK